MTKPLPIKHVHHIARTTRRLEASRRFYREVLGFREIQRPAFSFRGAWLYNYGVQIHLIEDPRAPDPQEEISTRADHLALHVDDIEEAKRVLREHGIPYRENLQRGTGVLQVFFQDPDGHHIELGTYGPTPPYIQTLESENSAEPETQ